MFAAFGVPSDAGSVHHDVERSLASAVGGIEPSENVPVSGRTS
jgi:hypothetical protein